MVAKTEVPDLSRMTIVLNGQSAVIDQAKRQLEDQVPVWAVLDYTHAKIVERELLMVKVSTVPHEQSTKPGHELEEEEYEHDEHHEVGKQFKCWNYRLPGCSRKESGPPRLVSIAERVRSTPSGYRTSSIIWCPDCRCWHNQCHCGAFSKI